MLKWITKNSMGRLQSCINHNHRFVASAVLWSQIYKVILYLHKLNHHDTYSFLVYLNVLQIYYKI